MPDALKSEGGLTPPKSQEEINECPETITPDISSPQELYSPKVSRTAYYLWGALYGFFKVYKYTYAKDSWLAEKSRLSLRTVQRCLIELEQKGFIVRETFQDPNNPLIKRRRIWEIGAYYRFSKNNAEVAMGGGLQVAMGGEYNNKEIKYINNSARTYVEKKPAPAKDRYGDHVELSKDEHASLKQMMGQEDLEYFIAQINDWIETGKPKPKSYAATIRTWYRRDQRYKKSSLFKPSSANPANVKEHLKIANAVYKRMKCGGEVAFIVYDNECLFQHPKLFDPRTRQKCQIFKYNEYANGESLKNALIGTFRKLGYDTPTINQLFAEAV